MATQIVELNGKKYTVTIAPQTGERGPAATFLTKNKSWKY